MELYIYIICGSIIVLYFIVGYCLRFVRRYITREVSKQWWTATYKKPVDFGNPFPDDDDLLEKISENCAKREPKDKALREIKKVFIRSWLDKERDRIEIVREAIEEVEEA